MNMRYVLAVTALALGLGLAGAEAKPLRFGGLPSSGGASDITISGFSTTATPATTAFLSSCSVSGNGPSYPPQWTWDPAKILGTQPQAATEAMGLTPKIEQYRGGTLIATWDKFNQNGVCNVANRSDSSVVDTPASHACGGPFGQFAQNAWQEGDTFLIYPAVYKEAIYFAPVQKMSATVSLTAGSPIITGLATTHDLLPGDAVYDTISLPPGPPLSSYISRLTHILSVDSSSQITLDKPILANSASRSITITRNAKGTLQGVTQNVGGVPTRPNIMYDGEDNDMSNSNRAMLTLHTNTYYDSDISDVLIKNLDFTIKQPPYGQRFWFFPNDPMGLILLSMIEVTGPVIFEDIRVSNSIYMNAGGGMGIYSTLPGFRGNTGTVTINRSEFLDNGGASGPAHHVYFDSGNGLVQVFNSYFHHVNYGHLIKLRNNNNDIEGNYFEGGFFTPLTSFDESNDINTPCGGSLVLANNIITKKHPMNSLNGNMLSYFEDGKCSTDLGGYYTWSQMENGHIDIHNNTIVSFAKRGQGGPLGNPNAPFYFEGSHPIPRVQAIPGDATFPTTDLSIRNNVFVGFCPTANRYFDFPWNSNSPTPVGPNLYADFSDIDQNFSLKSNYIPQGDTANLGNITYGHAAVSGATRAKNTVGAEDQDSTATSSPAAVPEVLLWATDYWVPGDGVSQTKLTWATTGATSCVASGASDWTGAQAISGNQLVTPPSSVETTYTLACTGPTGTGTTTAVVRSVDPSQTFFTSDVTTTSAPGQPVNFSWSSINASSCRFSDVFNLGEPDSGTLTGFPTQTITYSLACIGDYEPFPARTKIKITVNSGGTPTLEKPTVYFWASPAVDDVSNGTFGTLHWDSNGATACTGAGGTFSTGGAPSGSVNVQPNTRIDYTISCTGPGGTSATQTASVFGAP